jgi:hypothetical protein
MADWQHSYLPVGDCNTRIQKLIADQHWKDTDRAKPEQRFAAETQVLKPKAGL